MINEFVGRNTIAGDATLKVEAHPTDENWLKIRTTTNRLQTAFYLRTDDAPRLALALLQLRGGETYGGAFHHLEEVVLREEEQDRQRAERKAAREQEEKELYAEAEELHKASRDGGAWENVLPSDQERFMRMASRARALAAERAAKRQRAGDAVDILFGLKK